MLGEDKFGGGTELRFAPSLIAELAGAPIPIVASDALLKATASKVGDEIGLTIGGVRRDVRIASSVSAFPATDPGAAVAVMDLATLSLARFEDGGTVEPPDEWWLSVADGSIDAVAGALNGPPFLSREVLTEVGRHRTLGDRPGRPRDHRRPRDRVRGRRPLRHRRLRRQRVGLGARADQRVRAPSGAGLSSGQLSVWLSLENAVLATLSLLVGTGLGLVMAWIVLPFITVTQGAATPYPPVEVDVPWSVIGVLVAAGVLALGATIVALAWLLPRIGLASVLRMRED